MWTGCCKRLCHPGLCKAKLVPSVCSTLPQRNWVCNMNHKRESKLDANKYWIDKYLYLNAVLTYIYIYRLDELIYLPHSASRGTRGDVQPFVALARGLILNHHCEVTICTERPGLRSGAGRSGAHSTEVLNFKLFVFCLDNKSWG